MQALRARERAGRVAVRGVPGVQGRGTAGGRARSPGRSGVRDAARDGAAGVALGSEHDPRDGGCPPSAETGESWRGWVESRIARAGLRRPFRTLRADRRARHLAVGARTRLPRCAPPRGAGARGGRRIAGRSGASPRRKPHRRAAERDRGASQAHWRGAADGGSHGCARGCSPLDRCWISGRAATSRSSG